MVLAESARPDLTLMPPSRDPNQMVLGLIFHADTDVEAPRRDYSLVSPEDFPGLSGYEQEEGLRDRYKEGDLATIDRWRRDFRIEVPMTPQQVQFAADVRQLTDSDFTVSISYGPGAFARLHGATLFGDNSETFESLQGKLERVRLARNAHKGEPNGVFWSYSENIGDYSAEMLYRAELEADEQRRREQDALINVPIGDVAA